jgi:pimeloyl-ACP methyl ester carboxylesterase
METVEVDGLRVGYERAGQGPPLVLLHGYVGDGATTWRGQLEGLSDRFTVVAWDAPGAGGSSDPPESFGLAGYADCLARFIGRLGLEHPHVVGLSFGGRSPWSSTGGTREFRRRWSWRRPMPAGVGRCRRT